MATTSGACSFTGAALAGCPWYGHMVNGSPAGQLANTQTKREPWFPVPKGHDMTRNIEIGTVVIDASGQEYAYGGTSDMAGMNEFRFDMRNGGLTTIRTDLDQVAPLEVREAVNLKDGRILVTKMGSKPVFASGPWRHLIVLADGTTHQGWHKTKRDGTAEAAHRLAIADWHAGKG